MATPTSCWSCTNAARRLQTLPLRPYSYMPCRHALQEVDDIFGDPDEQTSCLKPYSHALRAPPGGGRHLWRPRRAAGAVGARQTLYLLRPNSDITCQHAAQEVDDIFGDPDELLELYERGKAARGSSRLDAVLEEAEPEAAEDAEGGDEEEAEARQEAFAQRQARPSLRAAAEPRLICEVEEPRTWVQAAMRSKGLLRPHVVDEGRV